MKSKFKTLTILSVIFILLASSNKSEDENPDSFTDSRDGHLYKTVTIGTQIWMAENLAYLPEVNLPTESSETQSKYYVYDYYESSVSAAKDTENYINYGVLYNWPAAVKSCPNGWHLPSDEEWTKLENYLSQSNQSKVNFSCFSALLGGTRNIVGGYLEIGKYGCWWSSTKSNNFNDPWMRSLGSGGSTFNKYDFYRKEFGFSVRCVKD
jgi:uncharacterized protein (TIGR02145 family)